MNATRNPIFSLMLVLPFLTWASIPQHPQTTGLDDHDNLAYSSFLGSTGHEAGVAIARDASGAVYLTGDTSSPSFPTTEGAYDRSYNGGSRDSYVVKLSADGRELVYATFLGGIGIETGQSIAVDGSGSVYVTGATDSPDFPTTPTAFDPTYNGDRDVFVVKLSPDGSYLEYATFVGGDACDQGYGVAVDGDGAAHVVGETGSPTFPVTSGGFDASYNGGARDSFALKLNPMGTGLLYSTFLGGKGADFGYDVAVDTDGAAHIVGDTYSSDFPVTGEGFDTSYNGGRDLFVAKLGVDGAELVYATYLGGSAWEQGYAIAVDDSGAAFVTGSTRSADFPTANAFDATHNGDADVIVAKLNLAGSELLYASFLGGSGTEGGLGIAVANDGEVLVIGDTESSGFPTTPDAYESTHSGGGRDAFVTLLDTGVPELVYSTFLGGKSNDWGFDAARSSTDTAYLSGGTFSIDFPTTPGTYDENHNGGFDIFLTRLVIGLPIPVQFIPAQPQGQVRKWQSFSGVYRDASGWNDFATVRLSLGRIPADRGGLCVSYETNDNRLVLRACDSDVWVGSCSPGEPVLLSNGTVQLDCRRSDVVQDGPHALQVTWSARWLRPINNPRVLTSFLRSSDHSGQDSGFIPLGTWTLLPGAQ